MFSTTLVILIVIVIVYALFVFVLSRLFVPLMGFHENFHRDQVPAELIEVVSKLENESLNAFDYANKAQDYIRQNWHIGRFEVFQHLPLAFRRDIHQIWQRKGYAHCTSINLLYVNLLTHSKFFAPEDILVKHKLFNFFIHQYLNVKIAGEWINADPSMTILKTPLGKKTGLFG